MNVIKMYCLIYILTVQYNSVNFAVRFARDEEVLYTKQLHTDREHGTLKADLQLEVATVGE